MTLAILLLFQGVGQGQFLDEFSDDDLTDGVVWVGDLDQFQVTDGRLQLQAAAAGSASLSTAYAFQDSLRYGVDVFLQFAPSSDNQVRIYLYHDQSDILIGESLILELGESGSSDAFILIHRDAAAMETEIHRFASIPHGSNLQVRVQVDYLQSGQWKFYFDHDVDGAFEDVQDVNFDFSPDPSGYFALGCRFTSTRVDKFYFDNAFVQKIVPDKIGPQLLSATVLSPDKIVLDFNEAIDGNGLSPNQFVLEPGNISPNTIDWSILSANQLCLNFNPPLSNQTTYTVEAKDIPDALGNTTLSQKATFIVFIPESFARGDIIINEIHAAPSDETLVPNAEFIELYNRSNKILNISDLSFRDASTAVMLPDFILFPDDYVIITDAQDLNLFVGIETALGVSNFPSLNNGGDQLSLMTNSAVIDQVLYREFWYENQDKTSGWSLECKNPESLCRGELNWTASNDPTGGTPGEINSVFTTDEIEGVASIVGIQIISATEVEFVFNLEMNEEQLENTANFLISPMLSITSSELVEINGEHVLTLNFSEDMTVGQIYSILFNTQICSCNGNKWPEPYSISFGLGEQPMVGDIRISEILFSPFSGESEFIEIVNTSQKIINVNDLWLHFESASGSFNQGNILANFLLLPDEYHVLTPVVSSVLNNYEVPFPNQVHAYALPSLTNAGGILSLFIFDENRDSVFIDDAIYSENLHDPLLDETNGISLERLRLQEDGLLRSNWYTSSTLKGGATPTGENSQRVLRPQSEEAHFSLNSPTFSPDGDGFEDVMTLFYEFDQPGFIAQAKIYSYDGVLIKDLANNESLGTSGQLLWSGDTNDGELARVGVYYVLLTAFRVSGESIEEKKKIVLARML